MLCVYWTGFQHKADGGAAKGRRPRGLASPVVLSALNSPYRLLRWSADALTTPDGLGDLRGISAPGGDRNAQTMVQATRSQGSGELWE